MNRIFSDGHCEDQIMPEETRRAGDDPTSSIHAFPQDVTQTAAGSDDSTRTPNPSPTAYSPEQLARVGALLDEPGASSFVHGAGS